MIPLTTAEIRRKTTESIKYPDTDSYPAASVMNNGFPSCYNLSFGEPEMVDQFGQYLEYGHDLIYDKIQPCIRHQDWPTILYDTENRSRYLSIFDMAGVGGMQIMRDGKKQEEIAKFSIDAEMDFLLSLGLE